MSFTRSEIDDNTLSDTSILNTLDELVSEAQMPFDLVFGKFAMTVQPKLHIRAQLVNAMLPHIPRLVAKKLAS